MTDNQKRAVEHLMLAVEFALCHESHEARRELAEAKRLLRSEEEAASAA